MTFLFLFVDSIIFIGFHEIFIVLILVFQLPCLILIQSHLNKVVVDDYDHLNFVSFVGNNNFMNAKLQGGKRFSLGTGFICRDLNVVIIFFSSTIDIRSDHNYFLLYFLKN